MYQLEERILFDGAAPAAVADAAKQAAAEAAKAEPGKAEAAAQPQAERENNANINPHDNNAKNMLVNPNPVTDQSNGIESYLAHAVNLDATAPAVNHDSANAQAHVLVVSNSLEQSQAITSLADANTVVVKYDAQHTTAAQLLEQINQALGDKKADSIAFFAESSDNGQMQLFADGKTTATSIKDTAQQQFWHGIDGMLNSEGRIDLVGSNLAATEAGKMLVQEIANASGHEITASTDLTGSVNKGGDWIQEYSSASDTVKNLDIASAYFDHNTINSFDGILPGGFVSSHQVAFINSSVMNAQEIVNDLGNDVEVVYLQHNVDGLTQITDYLNDHATNKYDAVHIISHGNEGYFVLNGTVIDSNAVNEHADQFVAWRNALSEQADINIYGCNLAASEAGRELAVVIAKTTGAAVAASTDSVGGNDWSLEYHVGDVNFASLDIRGYQYQLANQLVTNTNNSLDGSLRQAVFDVGDGQEITFDSSLSGRTITLSTSVINIAKSMTISGFLNSTGDNAITVSGNNATQIFNVSSGIIASLENLNLVNGYSSSHGGTINNAGALILNHVTISGSSADFNGGGIYNTGNIQMSNSTISGNTATGDGGGIYNDVSGKLYMDRVIISSSNTTASGGGIYNSGAIQMTNSTINNNTAAASGGALYNSLGATVMADSVTINDNTAALGAGVYTAGNFYGYDLTVARNTGTGIYLAQIDPLLDPAPYVKLENATIAYNSAYGIDNSTLADPTGSVNFVNTIVAKNTSGNLNGNNYTYSTDSLVNNSNTIFANSGALADNGGWVQTIALAGGSAAIDRGLNNGPSLYDARGYMINGTRDAGAYEYNAIIAINQNTLVKYSETQGIQTAINQAANGQTIELVGSRIKVGTQLTINHDIILESQGSGITVLDATGNSTRILYIDDGSATNKIYVRVSGISFTGGTTNAASNGGAIWNKENLLLKDTSFYNNTTLVSGGAIFNDGGFITLDRSELYSNTAAAGFGGAVVNLDGGMLIRESTIRNNTALTGGGIASVGSSAALTISNSTFNNNIANDPGTSAGGAIYAEGKVEMDNTTLAYNSADYGSALYLAGNGYWKFTNITVAYNTTSTGAAFEVEAGNLFLINSLIVNNRVSSNPDVFGHNFISGTANVSIYNCLITDTFQTGLFVSDANPEVADNGGWTKTLAILNNASVVNQGTNIGVPGYDQRGYGYNTTRDIGAYEYNGIIGIMTYVGKASPTGTDGSTTSSRISSLDTALSTTALSTSLNGILTVNLFNTRILEANIDANMWYSTGDTTTPRAARDIYLNGAVEGGTVISAGHQGNLFTLRGNTNGAVSPSAIMGKFYLTRVTVSDAVADNGPVVTGRNNANNVGAFIANEVSFVDNTAFNDGGALYVASWATQISYTVRNSIFSGNVAGGSGGAVAAYKPISITNSTIAYNRAFGVGGGIGIMKDGGGSGAVTLNGVTVAFNDANIAGGGVYNFGSLNSAISLYAKNRTTQTDNSSGLYGYDYHVAGGTLTDSSNNLVEYQNGTWFKDAPGTSFFKADDVVPGDRPQYHDIVGAQNDIFYTGYISDNGGFTGTVALSHTSAALDSQAGAVGTDQRNYDYYNYRDIGAFEFSGTYVNNKVAGTKYGSIQLAINNAAADTTLTIKDVRITEHDIQISKNIILDSNTTGTPPTPAVYNPVRGTSAVIDAESYGRVFYIGSPSTVVTINNFYMTGGMSLIASTGGVQQAAGNGGAIYNAGTLTMLNASITDSFAQVSGGAVYSSKSLNLSTSDAVALIPSTFEGNSAGLYGGAIYASNIFAVKGSAISAVTGGAGLYRFSYNTASSGGAIYLDGVSDVGTTESIYGANFQGNSASSDGGAVYITGGSGITVGYSYFTLNSAMNNGGMIFQTGGDLTIKDSTLSNAFAFGDGGGIYFNGGTSASMTIFATTAGTAQYMDIINNYSLSGDGGAIYMTTAADLNIYSQQLLYGVDINSNTAFNGSGGAIYFVNSNNINMGTLSATVNNVLIHSNYAGVSGGAIYMTSSADLNIDLNVGFYFNNANLSGGALYMIDSGNAKMNSNITFADNCAFNGSGGGMYFENVLDINISYLGLVNNFAGGSYAGGFLKTYNTTTSNGGGIYVKNSGNVALTDVDAFDNLATFDGGALYIEDNIASNLTIMSSGFYRNFSGADASVSGHGGWGYGGGVCVTLAADVLLVNTSFGYNANTALWLNSVTGSTTVKYATFAYNSDAGGFATPVSGIYVSGGTFAISDSIIYENEAASSPVVFNGVTVTGSSNNIFYRYDAFSATGLSTLTPATSITAYKTGGGVGGSAQVLDSSNNITGYDVTTNTFIQQNLYLSTEMIYHANNLSRALALESRDSIAYHYQNGSTDTRTGVNSDTTITYDQRGNMRSGITVNVDPTTKAVTYVYNKYNNVTAQWEQVTVAENGTATTTITGTGFVSSIGAFEPNFYMTTTNNTDNNTNPDFVTHRPGTEWHDIDVALTDIATSGVTLRESIFWIDTYKLGSTNNTSVTFSQDGSRYVKFADSMTNGSVVGRNIITLSAGAEYLSVRNDVLIGMIDNYTDGVNTYSFFVADNTFLAQNDSTHRITIDANNQSRILTLQSRADLSREASNWHYSPKVGLNNLTMTDGRDNGSGFFRDSSDGKGGGIYSEGTLTLNNSVVANSTASNSNIDYSLHGHSYFAGDGGGIYTLNSGNGDGRTGYLYVIDSTITGNLADGQNTLADITNVALGGGIFQENGTVQIVRSTISNNTAQGFTFPATTPLWNANGGGIYLSSGIMNILSSTLTGNQITTGGAGATTTASAHGDAMYQGGGTLTMNGNTVAYNHVYRYVPGEGRAVYLNGGSANLQNNIFANNYVVSTPDQIGRDIYAGNGMTIVANNNNIIGSYDDSGYNFSSGVGNIMGANETGVVTNLFLSNQLKYNGGMTQNYRLGANSVATNTGNAATIVAYDQRNLTRTVGGEHSIGAYELLTAVTTDSSVADVALVGGDITYDYSYVNGVDHGRQGWEMNLRNALYLADQGATVNINIIAGQDTFTFAAGAGALQIFNSITVLAVPTAGSALVLTVDPGNLSRAFIIDNSNFEVPSLTSTNVTLNNFRIINSTADNTLYGGKGGAIYSKGHLSLNNVSIESAVASGAGGAIFISGGNLTMNTVTIGGALATQPFAVRADGGDGGAIFIDSGSVVSSANVTIRNTSASGSGGAIYVNNATQTFALTDSTITNTFALEGSGGAIFYTGKDMILTHVNINGGHAQTATTAGSGGGIYAVVSGTVTLTDNANGKTIIENGAAANLGGGIFMNSGNLNLNLATVQNNTAVAHGGGIYANNSAVTLYQSSLLGNSSGGSGGGIYAVGAQSININYSTLGNNIAAVYGGGAYINASFSSTNSTYSGNTSGAYGGGIYFTNPGSINLSYVTIANNISGVTSATEVNGGGLYVNRGTLNMINSIVAQNYSKSIADANHNDLYFGTLGTLGSVTYSIVGINNRATGWGTGVWLYGDYAWGDLKIDTALDDNGGPTQTLYINSGSIAIGNGLVVAGITTDQRGINRSNLVKPLGPTIGAYEKHEVIYYYIGPQTGAGNVNVLTNWQSAASETPVSFVAPDSLFVFDNGVGHTTNVTISADWTVGVKAVVEVRSGGIVSVDTGTVAATATLVGTGILSINSSYSGSLTVKDSSTLVIATADANINTMVMSVSGTVNSTVVYSYTGIDNQTVRTGTYGNLTLTGGNTKNANGNITVNSNLNFDNSANQTALNGGAYDVVVTGNVGNTGSNGSIVANDITLGSAGKSVNLNGSITAADQLTISGASLTVASGISGVNGVTVNETGSVNIDTATSSNGSVSLTGGTIDAAGTISGKNGVTVAGNGVVNLASVTSSSGTVGLTSTTAKITVNGNLTGNAITINAGTAFELQNGTAAGTIGITAPDTILTDAVLGNADASNAINIDGNIISNGISGINSSNMSFDSINHTITVNANSHLTFFAGSSNITINDDGVGGVRAEALHVSVTSGILELKTNGNITANVVTPPTALLGTLKLSGETVTTTSARFDNTDWLIINNVQPITLSGDIRAINLALGNIILGSNSPITATNSIIFNGYIDGTALNHYNLTINAGNDISVNDVRNIGTVAVTSTNGKVTFAGTVTASGDVTATAGAGKTITITGDITTTNNVLMNNDVILSGDITTTGGNVTMNHAVNVTGSDTVINAGSGTVSLGALSGTGINSGLTITCGPGMTFDTITNLGQLIVTANSGNVNFNQNVIIPVKLQVNASGSILFSGVANAAGEVTLGAGSTITLNGTLNAGSLSLTGGTVAANDNVIVAGATSLSNTSATVYNGKIMTTGNLTINAGSSLNSGTGALNVGGNLNNAGTLVAPELNFNGASLQNITLSGITTLHNAALNNAAGAILSSNMTVDNFIFTAGKFNFGDNVLQIFDTAGGAGYGQDNYFVGGARGTLRIMVHNGTPTDFWVGNNNYASKVTIDGVTSDSMFGINTYNNVTGQGTINGETIIGIATAVNRTWVIDGTGSYNAVFAWNNAEGPSVGGLAVLSNYQVWHWVATGNSPAIPFGVNMSTTNVMPMSSTGTFSIAAPGTNFDYPTSFKGLNDNNVNSSGFSYPSMVIDVPLSQGELAYDGMEERLALNPLTNPLGVFIPVTGTDAGSLYADEVFTISGDSIYGTDGVYDVNPDTDVEYIFERNNDSRPSLEPENELDNYFVELAEINLKMEKHPAFKTAVDNMLDKLLAG